ncbi:MAG TPA: Ku protein, partial [Solirubrobacteraceae bacterium]|nr:Ku protein [Solirubrobacteraceae bacterium]
PERTHTIEIEAFVDFDAIEPAQFDHPYFLIPDSESEGAIRAYRLLRDAMAKSNQVAIGRVVIRSNEYLVAVRDREELLSLTTLRFADELRDPGEIDAVPAADVAEPARGEVAQAVKLIDAMTREFDPDSYEDLHRKRLLEVVERKRDTGEVTVPETDGHAPADQVSDLMAALKQSLARAKGS